MDGMIGSVIDFQEINLSDTMMQFKVRRNMECFVRKYVKWIGCYILLFLTFFSIAIIVVIYNLILGLIFLAVFFSVVTFLLFDMVLEENITIIKQFGIQISCRFLSGQVKEKFIDKDRLEGVFIHEYFYGSQVKYSIAFIVRNEEQLTLLYKFIQPGFQNMKKVYLECLQEIK